MKSKSEKTHKLRKTEHTWLKFSFPAIFFVTLFMLYPIVYSLFLSLFKHKGLKATFVGLNNYIELFQDSVFRKSLGNNPFVLDCSGSGYALPGVVFRIHPANKKPEVSQFFPHGAVRSVHYFRRGVFHRVPHVIPGGRHDKSAVDEYQCHLRADSLAYRDRLGACACHHRAMLALGQAITPCIILQGFKTYQGILLRLPALME